MSTTASLKKLHTFVTRPVESLEEKVDKASIKSRGSTREKLKDNTLKKPVVYNSKQLPEKKKKS